MNAWTQKPTDPGLYLYEGPSKRRIPVRFDGFHFWIEIPEGMRPNGQRAIMFRPAGGLFWRIPEAPALPVAALPLVSGDLGSGSYFEIRKYAPGPPPPVMPLIKVETCPGLPAGTVVSHYDGELVGMITNLAPEPPISGRWGRKDIPSPLPAEEGRTDAT
jgi:hypothetical protein